MESFVGWLLVCTQFLIKLIVENGSAPERNYNRIKSRLHLLFQQKIRFVRVREEECWLLQGTRVIMQ